MASLLTNESSMVALSTLRQINRDLSMVQQEISTGKSVSNARDNAAIWAVSTVMQSDVDSFEAISDSLNLGSSTVAVARGAAEQVTGLLQEMKNLIVAAQEDNVDRDKIQTDVDELTSQIDTIVGAAQFNGLNLLSGTEDITVLASLDRAADGTVTASDITVARNDLSVTGGEDLDVNSTLANPASMADGSSSQTTATAAVGGTVTAGEVFELSVTVGGTDYSYTYTAQDGDDTDAVAAGLVAAYAANSITDVGLSVNGSNASQIDFTNDSAAAVDFDSDITAASSSGLAGVANIDVTDAAGATAALTNIEGFIQTAIDAAAAFGSSQKRIDIQNEFVTTLTDSMKTGIGALTDTDMEEASARLQSLQVQQQLGVQALSIANQRPQVLLGLFQ